MSGAPPQSRSNTAAVAAVATGVLSLPAALTYIGGVVLGLAAVVLGFVGIAQAQQRGARGEGLSVAGIILGMLGMAAPVALSVFLGD